ncbi:MAG: SCP2 sterol-binding domain-containing protein [Actinobacteria bacterium]|nr:SCP2 sterol-binding domain-containing protein [Actinomycetota bacterium]
MAVKFLTEQWAQEVNRVLNSSADFKSAAGTKELRLEQVVTDAPQGPMTFYFKLGEGRGEVGLGELANADATITQGYDIAAAISRGETSPQQAFMKGEIKVTGNMMKLLQLQAVLGALSSAVKTVDVEY